VGDIVEKFLKNTSESSFESLLENLIEDLCCAYELMNEYTGGDRLIESFKRYCEAQESLLFHIEDKIKNVQFDIDLIEEKTPKANLKDIGTQNEKIQSLLINVLSLNSKISGKSSEDPDYNKIIELKLKLRNLLDTLKEKISDYNEAAKRLHRRKILSIEDALKNAIKYYEENIKSAKLEAKNWTKDN